MTRLHEGDTVLFEDPYGETRTGTVKARKGDTYDVESDGSVWLLGRGALTLVPRTTPGRVPRFAGMSTRETSVHSYGSGRVRSGPISNPVRVPDYDS